MKLMYRNVLADMDFGLKTGSRVKVNQNDMLNITGHMSMTQLY